MGKKRKAKHVIEAEKRQVAEGGANSTTEENATTVATSMNAQKKKRKKKIKKVHVKDPQEAHSYLFQWQQNKKQKEDDPSVEDIWRFNKNTQSWLLRHMYEVDKLSKGTFTILIFYLEDLKGASRQRVYEDAVRRALRYKNWEKEEREDENEETAAAGGGGDDQEPETKSVSNKDEDNNNDEEGEKEDAKRWNRLIEHDKRKEYKRARKVIDILKQENKNE